MSNIDFLSSLKAALIAQPSSEWQKIYAKSLPYNITPITSDLPNNVGSTTAMVVDVIVAGQLDYHQVGVEDFEAPNTLIKDLR